MELPVISNKPHDDPGTLIRAIKKANSEMCAVNGAMTDLECGRAFHHPDQPDIWDANAVYDLHQPAETTAVEVVSEITAHYSQISVACRICVPNAEDVTAELRKALNEHGYRPADVLCMQLQAAPPPEPEGPRLQIVSARDLRRAYREFRQVVHDAEWGELAASNMADFQINSLDEPRLDMFVARFEGRLVAAGGVYSAGEIGILWDIATHPDFRRRGFMKVFMPRLLEHCARSQFKSIVLETDPANRGAISMYESFGFRRLAEFPVYRNTPTRGH